MTIKYRKIDMNKVSKLYSDPAQPISNIAGKFDVDRTTIDRWAKKFNLDREKPKSTKPHFEGEIALFKKEWASKDMDYLRNKYKVAYNTLRHWASDLKARRSIELLNRSFFNSELDSEGNNDIEDLGYSEILEIMKNQNKALRKLAVNSSELKVNIDSKVPILVVFSADWHLGDIGTDYESFDKDMNTIRDTKNLYVYLGGDFFDNFIKFESMADGALNQEPILLQRHLTHEALKMIRSKILAIGTSCHMYWTKKQVGFDDIKEWAKGLKVLYTGHGGLLNLKVGQQVYTIFRRHKYRFNSQYSPLHSAKQLLRMGVTDAEVLVLEHWHVPGKEEFYWADKKRVALRPGTYKEYDEFALEHGFYGARKACPAVILFPDEHKILAFLDMYDAIECLNGLYGNIIKQK